MKKTLLIVMVGALLAGQAGATAILSRSGGTLKMLQVTAFVPLAYSQTAKSYNWTASEYQSLDDTLRTTSFGADVIVGAGLPFRLELCGVLPLASKSKGDNSSAGVGDAMAMVRWGVLQSGILPVRLALIGAVNLPTAKEGASPSLGNRSTDIGVGLAANTTKLGIIAAHLRAGYWLNGKDANGKQDGNFLEYIAFVEAPLRPSFSPYLGLSGVMADNNRDSLGIVTNSEKSQHSIALGITSKPVKFLPLWVKPKAGIPLAALSKGGELPSFTVGLDFWTVLP